MADYYAADAVELSEGRRDFISAMAMTIALGVVPPRARSGEPTWQTKDGRVLPIRTMTDDHLRNTVRMLNRSFNRATQIMGVTNFQNEAINVGPEFYWPEYRHLLAELLRRDLQLYLP